VGQRERDIERERVGEGGERRRQLWPTGQREGEGALRLARTGGMRGRERARGLG
jgi:hypothetical protein